MTAQSADDRHSSTSTATAAAAATATAASTGQVTDTAAEVYQDFFVPALFAQWPPVLCDLAAVGPGQDVLDVGCGTGVLARYAAGRLAGRGTVTGVDPNPGMLSVARRFPEPVAWVSGTAEDLPFPDASFDTVVSQFALMFMTDPTRALHHIRRVTRPGGTVGLAVWCAAEESPGYAAMIALLDRQLGRPAGDALRAPFALGSKTTLRALLERVLGEVQVVRRPSTARFTSLEAWMHTDIRGWTLADSVSDSQYERLLAQARRELHAFVGADGTVEFDAPALVAIARR